MLPPAAIDAADRLTATLMTLVHALAGIATAASTTPTLSAAAAQALFTRLATLVTTLIRISNFGVRAPATPSPDRIRPAPTPPRPRADPTRNATVSLPRRPGWLLAALPDAAPAIAADLAALLADPALAALLAAAPSLHRTLRPVLRGLDLVATQPPQPPPAPTLDPPPAEPHQAATTPHRDTPRPRLHRGRPAAIEIFRQPPSHAQFITLSK